MNAASPGVLLPQDPRGLVLGTSVTHLKPTRRPWRSRWETDILQQCAKSQPQDISWVTCRLTLKGNLESMEPILFLPMRKLKFREVTYLVQGFVVNNLAVKLSESAHVLASACCGARELSCTVSCPVGVG